MERKVKSLGAGKLKIGSSALYIVPPNTWAEVFKVTLAASSNVTLNIYHQIGPNIYRLTPNNLAMATGEFTELENLTMSPGGMLVGDCSIDGGVDFTVNGAEER